MDSTVPIERQLWYQFTSSIADNEHVPFATSLRLLRLQHDIAIRSESLEVFALVHGDHSVRLVCAALATCGYTMSVATYRDLEAGTKLPANPPQFFEAMAECLALSDAELLRLLRAYAYEILCLELGEPIARELILSTSPDTYLLTQIGDLTWV